MFIFGVSSSRSCDSRRSVNFVVSVIFIFVTMSVILYNGYKRFYEISRHEDHVCLFCSITRLRGIRRSVPRTVFQSLVSCLVLPRLDYYNAVLAGITLHLAQRLQSVMNAAAQLVFACLAPSYLADELHHPAESEFRRRQHSASSYL